MPLGLNPHQYRMGRKNFAPFSGQQKNQTSSIIHFDKFFIIKRMSTNNETFHNVSPFFVEKAITLILGTVSSTRKLRSGDLLVEVSSQKQSQQILKLKTLGTISVSVSTHATLNSSKGVITCGELFNDSIEKITVELKPEGVTHVRRITIRGDGQLLPTKDFILTFNNPKLPESVKVCCMKLAVRTYIPNPLRCFQCQSVGHSKASCRGTLTYARCGEKGHDSQQCSAPEKCVNCDGNYSSFSRSCPPPWILEKQIVSVKFKEDIPYPEARPKVLAQTPTPGVTYASITKKQFCANCSCANCVQNMPGTKPLPKVSDTDSEISITSASEPSKPVKHQRKVKTNKALKLKISKRGIPQNNLHQKMKKSTLHNSVVLGLASQGIVHKDLSSIFTGVPKSPDSISLHPSEEDDNDLQMSCELSPTPSNVPTTAFKTHAS
ncbi:uncharacterized protein LOC129975611 [Argiope bruennichi]|uniref:uncharacterized protein LOC129975611 n=1 Tax=Argiope bruennichi TaxID=94029 RepID=UPI0024944FF0|nr:uncharacterized protein LOC129975611 [Argiope bruennichi]